MSFQTKQQLSNKKFLQLTGDTLTLSGTTIIAGRIRYNGATPITGATQLTSKAYVDSLISTATGYSAIYNLASPASITLGGISAGYVLTGRTTNQIIQSLLVPTLFPTLTNPSNSFSNASAGNYEAGVVISFNVTANFNRGSISPQYTSASPFRSGLANTYNYSGSGLPATVSSTSNSNLQTISSYTVLIGTNSWSSSVSYDAGVQPKDSVGGNFGSPLAAGTTGSQSTSLTGYYLRFYGPRATSVTTSAQVRSLGTSEYQSANAQTFILNTGAVETKFIVALPVGRTISSVVDLDALNAVITSQYVSLGTISVNTGGGSGAAINYNIYEMNIGAPYSSSHRHQITTA
jgi:hypothetical protein